MTNIIYGFAAAQTQRNKGWASWPATMDEDGLVTLHDLSGFLGSRKAKLCDIFYPCETENTTMCNIAMSKSYNKTAELNKDNTL